MELTPEERERIYLEEKTRLEAREALAPKTRKTPLGIIFLAIIGVIVVGLALLIMAGSAVTPVVSQHRVQYHMDGAGYVNLTYINETGGSQQEFAQLPWSKDLIAVRGQHLYISGQLDGDGLIMLEIRMDGNVVQSAQTAQKYGIATASGIVP